MLRQREPREIDVRFGTKPGGQLPADIETFVAEIHAQRPLACREYLVTTPAANCARPTAETVRLVPLGTKVSRAVGRLGQDRPTPVMPHVPLVLALEWADAHAEGPPLRTGPELLREVFERLAGKAIPENE